MLGHKRTDVVSTWSVVFSLRKIRIPMSHKVRMAACISVCLAIKCYCVTSPCPWSLRHSTFRYGLLQNAIVWPIHVPDPSDTTHFIVVLQNATSVTSTCPWSITHGTFPYHTWTQRHSSQRHLHHGKHSITRHTTLRDRYGATFRC